MLCSALLCFSFCSRSLSSGNYPRRLGLRRRSFGRQVAGLPGCQVPLLLLLQAVYVCLVFRSFARSSVRLSASSLGRNEQTGRERKGGRDERAQIKLDSQAGSLIGRTKDELTLRLLLLLLLRRRRRRPLATVCGVLATPREREREAASATATANANVGTNSDGRGRYSAAYLMGCDQSPGRAA